ncbi:pentatricopeptide repeat-containing protein At3g26782, mitochondrial-like [Selaginella moellendorffii]|uniref:pentatricopeptide repeat-containing protein At3g26782, mitochondrial-like n=1 Tax=Selaginella moellendorffii TaxID=88036 RepID=UPI000D1C9C61|nr:pentatricopeptide repeat-containing protein At3g26782, mitochondrial-like [Selaginella moellendorffii]|eukprot:XP_024537531.1 pentatricopeptide repeat-containing protein At3g26782, mitochondrial-like [Selaginella moellendorffii]
MGMEESLTVGTSLVDFYCKCGNMVDTRLVFDKIFAKELAAWTALVEGYGRQGSSKLVMEFLCGMEEEGFRPDAKTLASVITACSHGGELEAARKLFAEVIPSQDYFVRMVDLLGRANELNAAVDMVSSVESVSNAKLVVLWRIILDACRRWKNLEVGKVAFKRLMDLDEFDSAAYVLFASSYD